MKCVSTANNVPRSYAAGRQDHSQRQTVVGSGAPIVTQVLFVKVPTALLTSDRTKVKRSKVCTLRSKFSTLIAVHVSHLRGRMVTDSFVDGGVPLSEVQP